MKEAKRVLYRRQEELKGSIRVLKNLKIHLKKRLSDTIEAIEYWNKILNEIQEVFKIL